jgi:hypothetical protein
MVLGWINYKRLAQKFSRRGRTGKPQRHPRRAKPAFVDARLPDLDAPNIPPGIGPNLERTNGSVGVEERVSATVLQMGI